MYSSPWRLRRPRVRSVAPGLHHEQGPAFAANATHVAVIAHWSDRATLSRSVQTLLRELVAGGYTCALVSSSGMEGPLIVTDEVVADAVTVFRRPNIGYDFGSWSVFLNQFPTVRAADKVLLGNDSLLGPFESIAPILDGFDRCGTDIWGVTSTTQDCPHLQSYLTGYSGGVLAQPVLREFWNGIRVQPSKKRLIRVYEMGLSKKARRAGLTTSAHFPWDTVVQHGQNPTSIGWRRLILAGFPFVKRELLLRPPPEVPDRADIPQVIRATWGQDVFEWV